jgi:hypothetical protein
MKSAVSRIKWLLAGLALVYAFGVESAIAQSIVPAADGTNTLVTPNGNRLDITAVSFQAMELISSTALSSLV